MQPNQPTKKSLRYSALQRDESTKTILTIGLMIGLSGFISKYATKLSLAPEWLESGIACFVTSMFCYLLPRRIRMAMGIRRWILMSLAMGLVAVVIELLWQG